MPTTVLLYILQFVKFSEKFTNSAKNVDITPFLTISTILREHIFKLLLVHEHHESMPDQHLKLMSMTLRRNKNIIYHTNNIIAFIIITIQQGHTTCQFPINDIYNPCNTNPHKLLIDVTIGNNQSKVLIIKKVLHIDNIFLGINGGEVKRHARLK